MKQKDIAALILIVVIALIASWLVFSKIIVTPEDRSTEVEKVQPISAEFPQPSKRVFKKNMLNPTELIRIGESKTKNPFNN